MKKKTYKVGYGKPPQATQFKPGQSGNPKGRPRGSKNLVTLFAEELDRVVEIPIGGHLQRQSKRQLLARIQVDKALKGDPKAVANILNFEKAAGMAASAQADGLSGRPDEIPDGRHDEIVKAFLEKLKGGGP